MKHLGWAVAAVISVGSFGSAVAADMAVKAPAPPAPILTWAGFYAGINAGGDWGQLKPILGCDQRWRFL
jgi:outer membrane immunogenic protein